MLSILLAVVLGVESSAAQPALPQQLQFFESKIRPILVEHCHKCHGPTKQWSGLRVDSRSRLLQGGDRGPAIVPGKPDQSLLVLAIQHSDPNLKMPPEERLSENQIADMVRWIGWGAPVPSIGSEGASGSSADHWAFQPLRWRLMPGNSVRSPCQTPIDQFVLEALTPLRITLNPPANAATLIRRVTFDLTGLPPLPQEIDEYLADARPDAFERLLDRLFATPAYGERWGRHWLDVARYADSNGLDENVAYGNAWRYRDYVVSSFNRDKPFDTFVLEQLAGDLLNLPSSGTDSLSESDEAAHHERLIATGFLGIGGKVLAEVNEAKMHMDIVDELIDSTGRTFLALTLGCARCHDHKFDPIPTTEYYGLAGIFNSTKTMESRKKLAKWHENLLASPAATALRVDYEGRVSAKKHAIASLIETANRNVTDQLKAGETPSANLESAYSDATKAELKKLRDELATLVKSPPEYPSAMGVTEDRVADVRLHIRGNPLKLGNIIPRQFPAAVRVPEGPVFRSTESGRRELAEWLIDPRHPLTSRVMVNRVWRWHFGQGLVRTTDNFGLQGESPSHPELLDYLAGRFIADGWQVKALQRQILCSHTYRQSSDSSPDKLERDPGNRWLARMIVRRLEAEEIRDAMLAVSGELDRTMGGSLLKLKNREYFFDHTSKDQTTYTSGRRSLYLPIVRNHVFDVFYLWDFPDPVVPTGDRSATTVAPQSLMMLNSDFVIRASTDLARSVCHAFDDNESRQAHLYQLAFSRLPTDDERRGDQLFIEEISRSVERDVAAIDRQLQAWSILCQVILASNEFIYLR